MTSRDEIRNAGIPDSWDCADCGMDTAPGSYNAAQTEEAFARGQGAKLQPSDQCELYTLKTAAWKTATKGDIRLVLCIGCVEKRLGRTLRPKDFAPNNELNRLPGTDRLTARRMGMAWNGSP